MNSDSERTAGKKIKACARICFVDLVNFYYLHFWRASMCSVTSFDKMHCISYRGVKGVKTNTQDYGISDLGEMIGDVLKRLL